MSRFSFDSTIRAIARTQAGRERAMYPHIRDLFVHALGHPTENVKTDSEQEGAGGNRPDVLVKAGTGVQDRREREVVVDWIVVEAKDEADAFSNEKSREEIFDEKSKYIRPGTEWFVMIDPRIMRVRPVAMRSQYRFDASQDITLEWEGLTEAEFKKTMQVLSAGNAPHELALRNFREGNESRIAVVKVGLPDEQKNALTPAEAKRLRLAQNDFLETIATCTALLQNACTNALIECGDRIGTLKRAVKKFNQHWNDSIIEFDPIRVQGKKRFEGSEEREQHRQEANALKTLIQDNTAIAKLTIRALPAYHRRTGKDDTKPFAAETANLILARVLLLRFFEDHNFFGNKKYVCNGGIKALQEFMLYYERSCSVVLEQAYKKGEQVYADAFHQTDLDWILTSDNLQLSRAVELTMMYLSAFDFSTVSGDILSGIYDRFLDKAQRKAWGEFYTPPSVARYVVERFDIQPQHKVFDPTCGSGTFLLEALMHMCKGDLQRGTADYQQVCDVINNIGGNDLNPFSAIVAQIQMLWHILPLKSDLKEKGFPAIHIADSVNAILRSDSFRLYESDNMILYEALDRPMYDFVIGNPPYVRPERSEQIADSATDKYYEDIGGVKKNYYTLLIYKALDAWCRAPSDDNRNAGRLGFVVPLSFCDSGNAEPLRKLFETGGRFRLLEIIDMEAIAPHVFDAATYPILLLAEKRPARKSDSVTIRVAGLETVVNKQARVFDLNKASKSKFKYAEIWTPEGNIATKLTTARQAIVNKMRAATPQCLEDIAQTYWVAIERNRIVAWALKKPDADALFNGKQMPKTWRWEQRTMLTRGAAERRQYRQSTTGDGLDYYKGENISACKMEGEPVRVGIDPNSLDEPSLWKYRDILPTVGYAFLRISRGINAARFNPHDYAFLNTATLLFPNEQWQDFPLDISLVSRVFLFYYALQLREGVVSDYWSALYPRNLRKIPFPLVLRSKTTRLNKLREDFLQHSQDLHNTTDALLRVLNEQLSMSVQRVARQHNATILWSPSLIAGEAVAVHSTIVMTKEADGFTRLTLNDETDAADGTPLHWIKINDAFIAKCVALILEIIHYGKGKPLKRSGFLEMRIPSDEAALKRFLKAVKDYQQGAVKQRLESTIDKIDAIIGQAFGLTNEDIAFVKNEMTTDSFLSKITPHLPYRNQQHRGLMANLAAASRYQ